MENILERRMVQKSFKIQLEILKEYFSANDLKLLILSRNNNLKIYSEVFNNLLTPKKNIEISTDLFNKIYNSENNKKIKSYLKKYITELNGNNYIIKINSEDYLFIIFFSIKSNKKEEFDFEILNKFKNQLKYIIEDKTQDENIKDTLKQTKEQNKNLKKEKYFNALALDSIHGNIAILDNKGEIRYTNSFWDSFAEENGIIPHKVGKGHNYLEVCKKSFQDGDKTAQKAYEGILSVIKDEDYFKMIYPCHSDQEKKWFRMDVSSFKGVGPYEVLIIHKDITEEILKRRKIESILESLPQAILKFNQNKEINFYNQKAKKLFEITNSDKYLSELKLSNSLVNYWEEKINESFVNNKEFNFNKMYETDEKELELNFTLIPETESGEVYSVIAVINNISYFIEDKGKLKKEDNYYKQLFYNSPDAIVLIGSDERIINVNESFCELFDYKKEEVLNSNINKLILPEEKQSHGKNISDVVFMGGNINKKDIRFNSARQGIEVEITAFPILLEDNDIAVYAIYKKVD